MAKVLTTGSPWRVILVFAIPLLIGNVVQQLYQATDAMVVGRHLGVNSLAAVGATASLLFLALGFAWGMASGFAIPTARAFGAQDPAGVRRSVATGVILTGATSLVLTIAAPLLASPALELLRTPEVLMGESTTFVQISFLGSSTLMFFNYLAAIIRAVGDSRTPLIFLALSCLLNIGLVLTFVGLLGYGVGGAALATVLAQATSVALCLWFVKARIPVLHVHRSDFRVGWSDLREHLRIGLPMGFQASIIAIGSIAVQVRLNTLGPDAVAAYTTAARVDNLTVTLLASLGLAVSMFVAQNHGGGRPDRIRQGVVHALWLSVAAAIIFGTAVALLGPTLIRLFVGEGSDQVVDMSVFGLRLNATCYTILGVLFVLRGALQGLGRTGIPMITGVIELVMRLGTAIILGAAFGYAGVVWGTPLAWAGSCALLIVTYVRAHKRLAHQPVRPIDGDPAPDETAVDPASGSVVTAMADLDLPGATERTVRSR